jgi:hypothetical protein
MWHRLGILSIAGTIMMAPEMVKIELRIACIRAKMIGYKLLHRLLASLLPSKIKPL